MFVVDTLIHRLKRGRETMAFPNGPAPALPDRHGGALRVDASKCADGCAACAEVCPTQAITVADSKVAPPGITDGTPGPRGNASALPKITLDLGRCVFCAECVKTCPAGAITQTGDHRMAVRRREDLVLGAPGQEEVRLAAALDEKLRKMFGRSLRLRQVSAGGSGAEEADLNVLGTIGWDLGRFGIQFVASPRHADGLVVTGPVSKGMELALRKTWEAMPAPKIVIAVGAEAISGGVFAGHPQVRNGVDAIVPVDLYIPGWPPHPLTILDGLLRLLGRLEEDRRS
ncbi:4Fe-4S dicluster domain-containing protein [Opitutus terrae]|uniref:NADH ubiquinone oxidoreductase 20 kDa subunit n=1 Tax=Opitutus terrae (strain DSM 11246 / JCM 15787 / PB90-1) TaxID=452637 RepID=B1ZSE7_OPITP|nr:4Fe-4S dicluster domain-containing protein [Opitutus terrae]ACB75749.1 NADH ubiquinone oxidoreductase 20 kDa subunit [Opitutus terrae PB90-1]